jgi:Putative Ig domain
MVDDIDSPAITSIDQATFMVGVAGDFTFTTSMRPIPVYSKSGPLPCGVTFTDMGDGTAILAGTPALGTVGRYPIRVTAFDGEGQGICQDFTLTIHRTSPT